MNVNELKKKANKMGLVNYSNMKRQELIKLINDVDNDRNCCYHYLKNSELKQIARDMKLKNYSRLKKQDLIKLIQDEREETSENLSSISKKLWSPKSIPEEYIFTLSDLNNDVVKIIEPLTFQKHKQSLLVKGKGTKDYRDLFKTLNGKWNKKLGGWIFFKNDANNAIKKLLKVLLDDKIINNKNNIDLIKKRKNIIEYHYYSDEDLIEFGIEKKYLKNTSKDEIIKIGIKNGYFEDYDNFKSELIERLNALDDFFSTFNKYVHYDIFENNVKKFDIEKLLFEIKIHNINIFIDENYIYLTGHEIDNYDKLRIKIIKEILDEKIFVNDDYIPNLWIFRQSDNLESDLEEIKQIIIKFFKY